MAANCAESPYLCHVFVCVNQRSGGRLSCGGSGNGEVRSALKEEVKRRGWDDKVRVSGSLCMGLCADGPNVLLYPQGIWFSKVSSEDVPTILSRLEQIVG